MKPMLKTVFNALVNDVRLGGSTPIVEWANVGELAHICWTDNEGNEQRRPLYRTTATNANTMRKRYDSWLAVAMTFEPIFIDNLPPSSLDEEVAPMTPTQAVRHMAKTLAALIEQSKKPGFDNDQAYSDIRDSYAHVCTMTDDLAIQVWLKNWICFWADSEEITFAELNQQKLDRLNHILATGWLPSSEAGATVQLSTLLECSWWGASEIKITMFGDKKTHGTATVTDEEGLYQIAFEWEADQGELAKSVDLPVIISITAARFTLPYDIKLDDCTPLEAAQELDGAIGLTADIFNVYFAPGAWYEA
ncbi:MAG: hypothetical protein ACDS79_04065 [Enterobacteriaceae bacterium]